MTEEELEHAEDLWSLSTDGPMRVHVTHNGRGVHVFVVKSKVVSLLRMNGPCLMYRNAQSDAEFIAHAYSFVPRAIQMIRELQAELAAVSKPCPPSKTQSSDNEIK